MAAMDERVIYTGQFTRVIRVGTGEGDWAWNVESPTGSRFFLRFLPGDRHRAVTAAQIIEYHRGVLGMAKSELVRGGWMPTQ